ncbi:MAG TPA: hypothetical protein PK604_08140 [Acetivibrio clariflavus]|nr:hypothetical protein [Acetivibrio clariflavus]
MTSFASAFVFFEEKRTISKFYFETASFSHGINIEKIGFFEGFTHQISMGFFIIG